MKIDRHNYEEFFILYWDGELTASQKQAVENFIKENADLQEEFKILGKTRFTPDKNVQLEEKEFLLNTSLINITNYEEQLLNYIDDELSVDERKEIERSTARYPSIQKELVLLQRTKLQPEAEVVFPDKVTLYRREGTNTYRHRVIRMTWFRVAVAAAIILIAGFATLRLVNTNKSRNIPPVAKVNESKDHGSKNKTQLPLTQPNDQPEKDKEQTLVKIDDKSTQQKNINPANKKSVKQNKASSPVIVYKPENSNNLPKERKNNDKAVVGPIETTDVVAVVSKENNGAQKIESDKTNTSFSNSSVTKSSPISFAKIDDSDNDDDFGKKEKAGLKELLRKTTRVFERRTKIQATTEDNKLLVGAFSLSLK